MNRIEQFEQEVQENISRIGEDRALQDLSLKWIHDAAQYKYSYNFRYMGRPIIQIPQDMIAMQEIIWQVRPDLIIETGIAHGGSLIMSASMLTMLDYCDAVNSGSVLDPMSGKRRVLGLDIDIRSHNREAIENHPLAHKIEMIQGSSIASEVIEEVCKRAENHDCILVCLDANHTHNHVLAELEAYTPLVSVGSYCCVFDTLIEDMPAEMFPDRPWGPGDNPKTAVHEFLKTHTEFEIDKSIQHKLLLTVAPDGFLHRMR
ncbi:MAG: cephalosporin hydroxylase family protein [Desulfoprunum sp.]|nr:cephalosporin hydroxylase family protein [Desulfoprunum sp.]